LDLYLAVVRGVMMIYKSQENIPTEHAQLDDNGDGRETELQTDYLEPELGGRAQEGVIPPVRPLADGALAARTIVTTHKESEPIPVPDPVPVPDPPTAPISIPNAESADPPK
jgi:hypothetical protein